MAAIRYVTRLSELDDVAAPSVDGGFLRFNAETGEFETVLVPETEPAGSYGAIQYNNGGEFGAAAMLIDGAGMPYFDSENRFYQPFAGYVGLRLTELEVYNGGQNFRLSGNGLDMNGITGLRWSPDTGIITSAADTGLARTGPGTLKVTDGGTGSGSLTAGSITTGYVQMAGGGSLLDMSWGSIMSARYLGTILFQHNPGTGWQTGGAIESQTGGLRITDGASGMANLYAGRVGIGTTDPQAALDVAGNIFANSQIASGNNGFQTYGNGVGRWFGRHLEITGGFPMVIDSTAGIEVTSPWLTTTGDIEITNAVYGPVLKDRTTGNRFRLLVDNGALSVELAA